MNGSKFERRVLQRALKGIGVQPRGDGGDIFDALLAAYSAKSRYYHSQQHISDCLVCFSNYRHLAVYPDEIEVALWFHDAIYDPRRQDNEALSAQWTEHYLTAVNADPNVIDRIVEMILATQTHRARGGDSKLLVDMDLSILGAPPAVFDAYDQAIRREYAWIPEALYRQARCEVLRDFLSRETLYQTAELRQHYEGQARCNLRRKVEELTQS